MPTIEPEDPRQKAYRAKRRTWSRLIGRPIPRKRVDDRPPPGEIDASEDDDYWDRDLPNGMIWSMDEP